MSKLTNEDTARRAEYLARERYRDIAITDGIDGSGRTVSLSFSSEAGVERWDPWEGVWYTEILSHDAAAVDLTRLAELGVALFNHDADRVIGRVSGVRLDGQARRCVCELTFDDDEEAEKIYRKVLRGTLRGVSVGYRVYEWEEVKSGEMSGDISGPAMIARRWEPYEISIVSCPADVSVGVGRQLSQKIIAKEADVEVSTYKDGVMELLRDMGAGKITREEFDRRARELAEGVEPEEKGEAERLLADVTSAVKEPGSADRERSAEIAAIGARYGLAQERIAAYIKDGVSVADVCRDIVAEEAKKSGGVTVGPSVSVEADERDKFRAAVRDGLRMRAGARVEKPAPGAEQFRGARLIDLARECVVRNGGEARFTDAPEAVAQRAFATADFPAIMSDLAQVTLLDAYAEAPTTWRQWCGVASASDFKEMHRVRFGEMPVLEPVYEGGEYKMADLVETKDSFSIGTFGKKFALTRQAIINDSLGAFTRIPQLFGSAAARTINATVYKTLTANPKIAEDGKNIFDADAHGNKAKTDSALSVASLSAARVAMRRQTGLRKGANAIKLNLAPKYLIIPPELETLARQIIYSDTDISAVNAGVINPMKGAFTPIVEAELAPWAWYIAADPSTVDTVEVAFLNGQQAPVIEQRQGWDVDGIEYKVRLDFGVWLYEYRGLYMNGGKDPAAE